MDRKAGSSGCALIFRLVDHAVSENVTQTHRRDSVKSADAANFLSYAQTTDGRGPRTPGRANFFDIPLISSIAVQSRPVYSPGGGGLWSRLAASQS